jgi:hypothetical protein
MLMDSCTFNKNYGLNVGYGSALVVDGRQNSTYIGKQTAISEA